MCMEDLVLGAMRYAKTTQVIGSFITSIKPDKRRVAILFSLAGDAVTDGVSIFNEPNVSSGVPFANLTFGSPNLLLRIEDYGSLVQGDFTIAGNSAVAMCITELILDLAIPRFGQNNG